MGLITPVTAADAFAPVAVGKNFAATLDHFSDYVVGDENSLTFKPAVRIKRWGEEGFFSFALPTTKNILPVYDGAKIAWVDTDNNIGFNAYSLAKDGDQFEFGGSETEYVFYSKPQSNVLVLQMETSGLDFAYQPPLSDFELKRGNIRPENVVGSYAAYHKSRSGMHSQPGAADKYRAGKAFHVYRPLAIDALGSKLWCDLAIDPQAGTMTITMDPVWLASAAYPVILDPSVGNTSLGATNDSTNNYLLATSFTAPSAGDANPGTAFVGGFCDSGTVVAMFGAYTGGGANPNGKSKLATSGQITLTTTAAYRSAAITWTGITNTAYWLSVNNKADTPTGYTRYDSATGTTWTSPRTHANDMPDPWPTNDGSFTANVSMYVDYTASGGAAITYPQLERGIRGLNRGVAMGGFR